MSCIVEDRQQAHHLAATLDADERVLATDVSAPTHGPTDRWCVEAILRGDVAGLPSDLVCGLAFDVTVRCREYNGQYRALCLL